MMFNVLVSPKYLKTLKKATENLNKTGKKTVEDRINVVRDFLSRDAGYSLDPSYSFHYFKGAKDRGDVHIKPDVVLIFQYDRSKNTVTLEYVTTHSNMKEAEKRLFSAIFRI